jgi:hypothetical protein
MEYGSSLVCVLGMGHLAAAVRVRLRQLMPRAPDAVCDINPEHPALFLACSDFENASLRRALGKRVQEDRCGVLFACLLGHSVRVGPFICRSPQHKISARHLTRSWDFSPSDVRDAFVHPAEWVTRIADARVTRMAQIGATCVVSELAKLLPRIQRVTENDSPTDFCQWRWLPEVGGAGSFEAAADGTLVALDDTWREVCGLPVRTWHPVGLG